MAEYKLVPYHPTPEMVEAAEDAHMPFGDMDMALRMAILAAPEQQAGPIGRPQIREVFLRNGFTINPDRDDLEDRVYEAAFELLQLAAPDVQGEPAAYRYRHLAEDWKGMATMHPCNFHPDHEQLIVEPLYTAPPAAPDVSGLSDPETVLVNMLRGAIAIPPVRGWSKLFGQVLNDEDERLLEIARLQSREKGLVEALDAIIHQYPNPDLTHEQYRVHACKQAEHALSAYREQQP